MRLALAVPLALLAAAHAATAATAAERTLVVDPAATRVELVLGATLHRVKGSVRVVRGEIRFDDAGGAATGDVVLDATSVTTGLASRDRKMHADVLESERFPVIAFHAERLDVVRRDAAGADVVLHGTLEMHGQRRPLAIPARVAAQNAGAGAEVAATFRVPYVDWGMRDPGNFLMRVDDSVDVIVHAGAALQ